MNKIFSAVLKSIASSRMISWKNRVKVLQILGSNVSSSARIGFGITVTQPSKLRIAAHAYINDFAYLQSEGGIVVEQYVRIGPHVKVLTRKHTYEDGPIRRVEGNDVDVECVIGLGCWIGAGSMLLPGVSIAAGCVVAAGSVVTRSTAPNGLYAGVPAKRIKDLRTRADLFGISPSTHAE